MLEIPAPFLGGTQSLEMLSIRSDVFPSGTLLYIESLILSTNVSVNFSCKIRADINGEEEFFYKVKIFYLSLLVNIDQRMTDPPFLLKDSQLDHPNLVDLQT